MKKFLSIMLYTLLLGCVDNWTSYAGEKWPGVDDAVVNKIAREHGREVHASLLPSAEGDLQLFMFLMAGTVGGFVAGYYWRVLLEGKHKRTGEKSTD